jgi:hypothetical protein
MENSLIRGVYITLQLFLKKKNHVIVSLWISICDFIFHFNHFFYFNFIFSCVGFGVL